MKSVALSLIAALLCAIVAPQAHAASSQEAGSTLVVYYSYTGNCREIMTSLTEQFAADVDEVLTVAENQDYNANGYQLGNDLLNAINADPENLDSYPPIKAMLHDVDDYDNVIVITPLWHSQMAAPMQTWMFMNRAKLAGKRFALIVSSWSSGITTVEANARRLAPDADWMGSSLWINHNNHANRDTLIAEWLTTLNFAPAPPTMTEKLHITIDGVTMTATMVNNSSTQALVAALQQADITYEAHDYGGFEKVGDLGQTFPRNDEDITTVPGDLILYLGKSLCIYYDTNQWDFTRIGKIDNATQDQIKSFVHAGGDNVIVTLSLSAPAVTGDLDGNGRIDVSDINVGINVMLGKVTDPAIIAAADLDVNGRVDISDINRYINIMLGKSL